MVLVRSLVFILLLLSGLANVVLAASENPASSSKHPHPVDLPVKTCTSCHEQQDDIMKLAAASNEKCVACGLCIKICPLGAMEMSL